MASKENDDIILNRISYIYYPLCFSKNKKNKIQALINSGSKVNAITPAYALKLALKIRQTGIGAEKINGSIFETFGIMLASF